MKRILESSKYLVLVAVISLLAASLVGFIYGVVDTFNIAIRVIGSTEAPVVDFIALIDTFLIAVSLLIFAVALYELFVGKLNLPDWLVITHISELKELLSGLIILIMSVKILDKIVAAKDPNGVLALAASMALVSGALIAMNKFGDHGHNGDSAHSSSEKH